MSAVYNVVWDASTPGNMDWGISAYQITWTHNGNPSGMNVDGNTTSLEVVFTEGAAAHVEVRAVGQNGLVSDAAVLDFTAAVQPPPPPPPPPDPTAPSVPGNLRADFARFQ